MLLHSYHPSFNACTSFWPWAINNFQWLVICNKIKWHTITWGWNFSKALRAPAPLSLSANIFSWCLSDYNLHSRWLDPFFCFWVSTTPSSTGLASAITGVGASLLKYPKVSDGPITLLAPERPSSVHLRTWREFLTLSGNVRAQRLLPGQVWSGHSSLQAQEDFRLLILSRVLTPLSWL